MKLENEMQPFNQSKGMTIEVLRLDVHYGMIEDEQLKVHRIIPFYSTGCSCTQLILYVVKNV